MKLDDATLEIAACALERRHGNELYRQAWRTAARVIRAMKSGSVDNSNGSEKLIDKSDQPSANSEQALGDVSPGVKAGA